jgi:hypothetical protein
MGICTSIPQNNSQETIPYCLHFRDARCTRGDKCKFRHVECRFGPNCTRTGCKFGGKDHKKNTKYCKYVQKDSENPKKDEEREKLENTKNDEKPAKAEEQISIICEVD